MIRMYVTANALEKKYGPYFYPAILPPYKAFAKHQRPYLPRGATVVHSEEDLVAMQEDFINFVL
jgi:hypothetical protein